MSSAAQSAMRGPRLPAPQLSRAQAASGSSAIRCWTWILVRFIATAIAFFATPSTCGMQRALEALLSI